MKLYTTLSNGKYDLDTLDNSHKDFIEKIIHYYKRNPNWNNFANYWHKEGQKIWKNKNRKEVVKLPIFKICQDLESRLGIKQGYVRQADYRDELLKIIEEYQSRYQFCRKTGIDEAFLSHILSKRKNLSIVKLQELLEKLGYEITFTKREHVTVV